MAAPGIGDVLLRVTPHAEMRVGDPATSAAEAVDAC
jgi:hypothetical protein